MFGGVFQRDLHGRRVVDVRLVIQQTVRVSGIDAMRELLFVFVRFDPQERQPQQEGDAHPELRQAGFVRAGRF
ncbi:hypothetical protein C5Y93_25170 [Blastopirellula marina]|uniref:Uncharacterized protein n=1 Tax=Blastopirellula marina TaxID=124 RepID=A0A2S8GFH4_9BACT|nr:hypothetical protein C5Y93_25170 [Blastopirellula marina]